jgi:amidase
MPGAAAGRVANRNNGASMEPFPEYEQHDAMGLAKLIRTDQIPARDVVEAAISRIQRRNPAVNAVVTPTFDRARAVVDNGVPEGPLRGVPFLLKDLNHALAGVRLTDGSRSMRDYVPPYTSTLVERHEAAGLVVLGMTNTPEFGITPVTEPELHGPCATPWDVSRASGGSSGGAAAAVAAGMVPAASASDGGGSIRIPASNCGLFGLKPTRARTPAGPVHAEGWFGLSVSHAVTRSVRDSAALLDATHGPELGAPYLAPPPERPFLAEVGTDPGRLRVGLIGGGIFHGEIAPECRTAVADAAALVEALGHDVVPVRLPVDVTALVEAFLTIVAAATAAALDDVAALRGQSAPDPDDYELLTWMLSLVGRNLDGRQVAAAITRLRGTTRTVEAAMADGGLDVLLTSTLASPPLPHHALDPSPAEQRVVRALRRVPVRPALLRAFHEVADTALEPIPNLPLFNATGQPAMSVPLHWTADGLPVGVQFVGRYGDEATLLRLAAQLEAAQPWFDRRPPLW